MTVVIPCYNYGRYVEEAVTSVLEQTLQPVEVIVVDDGSNDPSTLEVLDRLDLPFVRVLHQPNAGTPMARNRGAGLARSKYVCCLDADDTIEPTYLEKAVTVMEARSDVGFVASWVRLFGDRDDEWRVPPFDLDRIVEQNHLCSAAVFRKDLWAAAGGFSIEMREGYADWEFWLRLGSLGVGGWCIPELLLNYRKHEGSGLEAAARRHEHWLERMRRLNPEVFEDSFRASVRASLKPVHAPRPFDWLSSSSSDGAERRPALLVVASRVEADGSPFASLAESLRAIGPGRQLYIVLTNESHLTETDPWTAPASFGSLSSRLYYLSHLLDPSLHAEFLQHARHAWNIDIVLGNSETLTLNPRSWEPKAAN